MKRATVEEKEHRHDNSTPDIRICLAEKHVKTGRIQGVSNPTDANFGWLRQNTFPNPNHPPPRARSDRLVGRLLRTVTHCANRLGGAQIKLSTCGMWGTEQTYRRPRCCCASCLPAHRTVKRAGLQ